MLNRKLNNYIFYGIFVLVFIAVFGLRVLLVGSLQDKIIDLDTNNIKLQSQIDALEQIVQENKNVQTSHLYELYDTVPNSFSATNLTYKTVAILESVGVTEANDMQRTVYINDTIEFPSESDFYDIAQDYSFVEIQVSFTTLDSEIVKDFIDELFTSNQLFIINNLEYATSDESNYVVVTISFYAVYNLGTETELDYDVDDVDDDDDYEDEE